MSNISKKLTSLSAKKKAVLELKLKRLKEQKKKTRQQKAKIESPKIVRRTVTGPLPLSLDQERLWFISQFAPENAAYNIHTATRLLGPLDVDLLEKSLNEVIKRHDVLRTSFIAQNGQPMQVIAPTLTLKIPVIDVQDLSPAEQEAQVMWYAEEEAQLPFDMTKAPLLRVWLLKISDVNYVIYLNQHHIITDWWSAQQLFQEMATIYDALLIGQPLVGLLPEPYQYTDFVLWERERLEKQDMERSLAYWRKHLAGGSFQLDLPIAKRRPAEQTFVGLRQKVTIPPALGEALKAFSRRENVTLFMTLTAAFKALLFRYSGQTDITLGTPLANRSQVELEHVLGFLITMLVLHSDFSEDISFNSLVHKERQVILEAYAHQDVPFAKLLEMVQLERDWSRNPLFQFSFIFLDDAGRPGGGFKSLEGHGLFYDPHASRFDMTLIAEDHGEKIICYIEYNTDLFEADSMARFAEHFRTLLESMVAAPDKPIAELPMMTEAERQQVLFEWNDTQAPYPTEMCMQHLFEAQVERTPLAVAVTFGEASLTYHELNQRANQLAYQLLKLGVGPEVLVGICVERSLEMVVGLLGILKAGGAYVALDPAYPKERQAFTLQDAKVSILLTEQHLADTLPSSGLTLLFLDQAVPSKVMPNPVAPVAPHNLAYILYTSGSTGRPKGVAIEHRSVVAFLSWAQSVFPAEELAGVLASTSICFDLSVFEIFLPLSCGGTVIVVENALALPTLPANPPVTLINTVPSAMRELVRMNGVPKSVRVVNLAGEPLPNTLVQAAYAQETVEKVYNLYGPSEDTTYSTFVLTEKGVLENPSIGRPIANTQAYLLDRALQPVPIGLPGQLYLGGAGLARGYLNRPALTTERFVDNPFGSGRLYNTGDLARYLLSEEKDLGNIQFLGRIDHQVKLRGFRIELGEIETILSQHGTVQETVVIVREDQAGDQRLVAYIVLSTAEALRRFDAKESVIPELRAHLKQKLPDYMIPGFFVVLDHLPLTPNGKIDRRALPAPDRSSAQESYMPPSTPTEERLAAIWADILGVARVGRHDDFFMLGGHSLLVMQVILQVNHALEIDLPLRQLLSNPTVFELAEWIESTRQTLAGLQDMTDIGDEDEDEREEFVL